MPVRRVGYRGGRERSGRLIAMRIISNDSYNLSNPVEVTLSMVDASGDPVVWQATFGSEEPVFFECPAECDALDLVDAAFAARRSFQVSQVSFADIKGMVDSGELRSVVDAARRSG